MTAKEVKGLKRPRNYVVLAGDARDPWLCSAVYGVYQYKKDADAFAAEHRRRDSSCVVEVKRLYRPHLGYDMSHFRSKTPFHDTAIGWLSRATELLAESLSKWEDEEPSVQEEKAEHIAELNEFFEAFNKRSTQHD